MVLYSSQRHLALPARAGGRSGGKHPVHRLFFRSAKAPVERVDPEIDPGGGGSRQGKRRNDGRSLSGRSRLAKLPLHGFRRHIRRDGFSGSGESRHQTARNAPAGVVASPILILSPSRRASVENTVTTKEPLLLRGSFCGVIGGLAGLDYSSGQPSGSSPSFSASLIESAASFVTQACQTSALLFSHQVAVSAMSASGFWSRQLTASL